MAIFSRCERLKIPKNRVWQFKSDRLLAGVTSDMRIIVHGAADRVMQITAGPAEIGRREWLEFMVEEFSS